MPTATVARAAATPKARYELTKDKMRDVTEAKSARRSQRR
jgi:hypothetical protein